MLHALKKPDSFDFTLLKDLEEFIISVYPGKQALKEESSQRMWIAIFSAVVESIRKPGRDGGIASYTSTYLFST